MRVIDVSPHTNKPAHTQKPLVSRSLQVAAALQRGKANRLLRPVGVFLSINKPTRALRVLASRIRRAKNVVPAAVPYMYRAAASAFIRLKYTTHALTVIKLMKDADIEPTLPLRALYDLNVVAEADPLNHDAQHAVLRPYLNSPAMTPSDMRRFIIFLGGHLAWPTKRLMPVLSEYLASHKNAAGGTKDEIATQWIQQTADVFRSRPREWDRLMRALVPAMHPVKEQAFSAMLRTAPRSTNPRDLLAWMAQSGIKPNSVTIGALMHAQVGRRQYNRALDLYHFVRGGHAGPNVVLTAEGVTAIVRTLQMYKLSRSVQGRKLRRHKFPPPGALPAPRQLYADMVRAHARLTGAKTTTLSVAMKTGAINAVLRELLRHRDYIGAHIALRAFPSCSLLANFETWRIVMRHLTNRIAHDYFDGERGAWATELLKPLEAQLEEFNDRPPHLLLAYLVHQLGSSSLEKRRSLSPPELVSFRTSSHGYVPSPAQLVGEKKLPPVRLWDYYPLLRMLDRAAAAQLGGDTHAEKMARVSEAILKAKEEMIPQITSMDFINPPGKTDNRRYRMNDSKPIRVHVPQEDMHVETITVQYTPQGAGD